MSDVTFGVKVPEELKLQIDNLIKDSGLRTGKDFMQSLINSYVLEKTKESLPEVAEDLKELQSLTQRIDNIYLNLGYRIDNITKAQQEQQQQLLGKKDSIILDLQSKIEMLSTSKDSLIEENNNIVNLNNEHIQRVNELTEGNNNIKALNEEYKNKIDTMAGIVEEYKSYKVENETVKALLASQQSDNIELKDSLKVKDFTVNGLNKDIEKLNKEHERAIIELGKSQEQLKDKHISDIEQVKDKASIIMDKALLELQKAQQSQLSLDQSKYNKEVQEYQNKYKALLEELESMRAIPKSKKVNAAITK